MSTKVDWHWNGHELNELGLQVGDKLGNGLHRRPCVRNSTIIHLHNFETDLYARVCMCMCEQFKGI